MLSRSQLIILGVLLLGPLLIFAGIGGWALWETNRFIWVSWSVPACWGLAWLLRRWWGKSLSPSLPDLDVTHWTPRDEAAALLVRQEQELANVISAERLAETQFYIDATQQLAYKIARHYHPRADDPLGSLTVIEILAATRLVAEDLESWFASSVPGGHLVTITQWQMLSHAPRWWQYASNAGWVASILLNPVNLGRYFVSKLAVDPLSKELQGSFLTAFYLIYLRQVGYYLIEMNSGRLRGGTKRYRAVMDRLVPGAATTATHGMHETLHPGPVDVTIAVIGQVKAGKSSLVNCLLGDQRATVDVLPSTQQVNRYRVDRLGEAGTKEMLTLLDTPGYADAGASEGQFEETLKAVRQADLVLLVMDAKSPAKRADQDVLNRLSAWYTEHPHLKTSPMVGVITKIDALSPLMEWQPPYDWTRPTRPKEESIAGAVNYVRELFGHRLDAVVSVCSDSERQRSYGITEFLIPAMTALLPEARAVSLVKTLHADQDQGKFTQLLMQALSAGRQAIDYWQSVNAPPFRGKSMR